MKVNCVGRHQSQGLYNSLRKIQTNARTMGQGVSLHEVMQSRVACIPIPCMQLSLHDSVLSDKSESRPIPAPEQIHQSPNCEQSFLVESEQNKYLLQLHNPLRDLHVCLVDQTFRSDFENPFSANQHVSVKFCTNNQHICQLSPELIVFIALCFVYL